MASHLSASIVTASGLVAAGLASTMYIAPAIHANETPIELGTVGWMRNYESGLTMAKQTDRDLLMLFQEVPG